MEGEGEGGSREGGREGGRKRVEINEKRMGKNSKVERKREEETRKGCSLNHSSFLTMSNS